MSAHPFFHTLRGTIGSSAQSCRGRVSTAPPPFRRTPHTLRGTVGSPPEGPSGRIHMAPPLPIRRT
eukprot:1906454-Pyramimonas_sp.AAC.1